MNTDPFAQCRGCRHLGRDAEDGWPVCRHPQISPGDPRDATPALCVDECPIGRWRRVNGAPSVALHTIAQRAAQHEGREAGLPGRTDRASKKLVTCLRCGARHPYASIGNPCTACIEERARAEEITDALAAGYRMDRRGAWHRIEQAREERGVFGEDGGRD